VKRCTPPRLQRSKRWPHQQSANGRNRNGRKTLWRQGFFSVGPANTKTLAPSVEALHLPQSCNAPNVALCNAPATLRAESAEKPSSSEPSQALHPATQKRCTSAFSVALHPLPLGRATPATPGNPEKKKEENLPHGPTQISVIAEVVEILARAVVADVTDESPGYGCVREGNRP